MAAQRWKALARIIGILLAFVLTITADAKPVDLAEDAEFWSAVQDRDYAAARAALARGADVDGKDKRTGRTILIDECMNNADTGEVAFLLQHGARVNSRDKDGNTALILLSWTLDPHGVLDCAKMLVAHGARLRIRNYEGRAAMQEAANKNCVQLVEYIHSLGVGLNEPAGSGDTPLTLAVWGPADDVPGGGSRLRTSLYLIDHGANVNLRNGAGRTALMRVSMNTSQYVIDDAVTIAKDLIAHGARVNLRNPQGHTAYEIATANHSTKMAAYLKSVGGR